jgi:hypothetical protein
MVAAQEKEVLRVLDLVGQKKAHALEAVFAPVDIVTA